MINQLITVPFEVVERFGLKNGIPLETSLTLHNELLSYLDMQDSSSPSNLIDEVWHHFILHTKLYQSFCQERYGKFIHHIPHGSKADILNQKVRILLGQRHLALANAKCNDGGGDGNCSNDCGQGDCTSEVPESE